MTDNPPIHRPDSIQTKPSSPQSSMLTPSPENPIFGPNGLRAGWRILIAFLILYYGGGIVVNFVIQRLTGNPALALFTAFTARGLLLFEVVSFAVYLVTVFIMMGIEGRRFRDYGLGLLGAFAGKFWIGAAVGFGSISLLLGALKVFGVFHLGPEALHGTLLWKDAGWWGLTFLLVGFREECVSRGYFLFTLATGIGFWPAAIGTSLVFGWLHLGNTGESYVGALAAAGIGFFFCILLRKTGNLWAAIGFHAAWDWGETFFYGVPDSGFSAQGHLFSATFAGPVWLTGGSVGPEGSWLCLFLIILLCIAAAFLPGKKFPDPDAIPDPRHRHHESAPMLFPDASGQLPGSAA